MKVLKKVNGKKTESLGLLMIIFQALIIAKPDLFSPDMEKTITIVISSGVIPTLGHRIWRNRKKIGIYIKNIFKRKENE